jgi:tRNA G10  N-methylase Trm11
MDKKSFLILGRQSQIAFAEIYQYFGSKIVIEEYSQNAVVLNDDKIGGSAPSVFGGVPKSGFIIIPPSQRYGEMKNMNEKLLSEILLKFTKSEGKFNFGLSGYDIGRKVDKKDIKNLGLRVKNIIKESGFSVRLVESRGETLSSADVVKNKLLGKGVELCLFFGKEEILVGKTEAVQPFEDYSDRDYGRPSRDMKRGMIPPKLALSMVNMSGAKPGSIILDPFCGIGTILQEALLAGYEVIGADIDESATRDAKKNIKWLLEKNISKSSEYKIETCDARNIGRIVPSNSVDAIVSELDLGPALSGREDEKKIFSIARSLSEFYSEALVKMSEVLKKQGRAVLVMPNFPKYNLFVSNLVKFSGWKTVEPYPREYQNVFPLSSRGTMLYGREDQSVFREIIILEKQ